jgi:hypothetical protein
MKGLIMKARELTRLIGVLVIGFLLGAGITPLNAADPVASTGEILKVCINTKTGALRVANKCTSAERKTVLGGVGAKGDKGDVGEKGATGDTGAVGETGAQGPAGTNGINGATGATGLQGEKGAPGATGAQGPQGFTGSTGATGSVASLRTRSISILQAGGFGGFCSSYGGTSYLNGNTSISVFGGSVTLNKSCSNLLESNITVYVP